MLFTITLLAQGLACDKQAPSQFSIKQVSSKQDSPTPYQPMNPPTLTCNVTQTWSADMVLAESWGDSSGGSSTGYSAIELTPCYADDPTCPNPAPKSPKRLFIDVVKMDSYGNVTLALQAVNVTMPESMQYHAASGGCYDTEFPPFCVQPNAIYDGLGCKLPKITPDQVVHLHVTETLAIDVSGIWAKYGSLSALRLWLVPVPLPSGTNSEGQSQSATLANACFQ
uniref:Uncharacterized protein n=1 Tax=Haptolina brevifila TaxID=156173 RepID=A0A7S2N6C3_9EUKA|mmetsp:Transcript_67950/g.134706  ORF Transcript_67950/g.134706 Transcript_67950/m.134706 type:complete len:225 (+) Transcript_67950:73-747(+)